MHALPGRAQCERVEVSIPRKSTDSIAPHMTKVRSLFTASHVQHGKNASGGVLPIAT